MANIDECISLLNGPTDERRFVGLLLVVKLLPSEDYSSALRIWEAIGTSFLKRMLLPVTSVSQIRGPEPSTEKIELHLMSCSVGTAVLSNLCRFENISKLDQILEFLPLISQVWSNRAKLKRWSKHSGNEIIKSIFQDVLGIFISISSGSEQGKKKAMESNGMEVALWALKEWKGEGNQIILMAMNLLSNLLEGTASDRIALLQGNEAEISEAVQSLSQLLVIEPSSRNNSSPIDEMEKADQVDPAMLQLEALHALLLIFPLPLPQAENVRKGLISSQSEWWGKVRFGLTSILQSKTTLVQRHSALQLAAAMTELMGSEWLVKPYGEKMDSNDFKFFRLVVEIVSIEVPVLLRDVVEPSNSVDSMVEKIAQTSISNRQEGEGSSSMGGVPSMAEASSSNQSEEQKNRNKILSETRRSAALRSLPICFWLIEAVLDILTASENLLENEMTGDPPIGGLVNPMDDAVALRTINTITETIGHVLEYVSEGGNSAVVKRSGDDGLLVACSRCVGRFLADVPIAHTEAVKTCLEVLVRCGDMHEGVEFMAPGLLQLTGGKDSKVWSNLCSRKPIFNAIVQRAGFLCEQIIANFSTQASPDDNNSDMVIYSESKLGLIFHLISNIVLRVSDPSFHSNAVFPVKAVEAATEWAKGRMGCADMDVLLVVALVIAVFIARNSEQGRVSDKSEKLVEEALGCVLNAAEIGHKGLVADEEMFQQECGDTWEQLVHFLTMLIEGNPKAQKQAKSHIYIQNGIRLFGSEAVGCVEDVSWQLFLKTVEMGDTHM